MDLHGVPMGMNAAFSGYGCVVWFLLIGLLYVAVWHC